MVTSVLMSGASLTRSLAFSVDTFDMIGADTGRAIELVDVKSVKQKQPELNSMRSMNELEMVQITIDSSLTCGICVNGCCRRCCWRCGCIFQFELWEEKEKILLLIFLDLKSVCVFFFSFHFIFKFIS